MGSSCARVHPTSFGDFKMARMTKKKIDVTAESGLDFKSKQEQDEFIGQSNIKQTKTIVFPMYVHNYCFKKNST